MSENIPEGELIQSAFELQNIDRAVVRAVVEWNPEQLTELVEKFSLLKTKIKLSMISTSVLKVHDPVAQDILQKISLSEPFQTDIVLKAISGETADARGFKNLSEEELWDLGDKHFYSWFSHYEYVKELFYIGALIVGISVPEALRCYVEEARRCYAFQQYNGVYSLCRTILEAAVRHTCQRNGRLRKLQGNIIDFDAYAPRELIRRACHGSLKDVINRLYNTTSAVIHWGLGTGHLRSWKALLLLKVVFNSYWV